jgi:hypothetical protein
MSTLLLGLALAIGAPALKEPTPNAPPLVGRWACAEHVGLEYEFTADGRWIIYQGGKVIDGADRTYKLMPKEGTAAIDLWERPGPGYEGVFRIAERKLSLCFRHNGEGRPETVDAQGVGLMPLTFTRVKSDDR